MGKSADVQIEPGLYAGSAPVLLEVLHEVPDEVESVMLIGHNPGIQDLALSLARADSKSARVRSKFPTAALATLEHNGSWRELAAEERRELPPLVGAVRRLTHQVSLPARSDRRSTTVIL